MICIIKTDNNSIVEKNFKKVITSKNLNRTIMFKEKNRTELFVTNDNFTLKMAISVLQEIVDTNPTKTQIEEICNRDLCKILTKRNEYTLSTKQVEEIRLEKLREITKQKEIESKQKEIELKIMQTELEIIREKKETIIKPLTIKSTCIDAIAKSLEIKSICIYEQFLNNHTEKNTTHIKTTELYDGFKHIFMKQYPCSKIPSNREFIRNIKKYVNVVSVKIEGKSYDGVKFIKLKNID
jgi:hypothetical protein